jgi:hypothetical protein
MRKIFLPPAVLSATAIALCLIAAPLHAHEDHASNLDVVLDRVSPHPARLDVQIVSTLAPQMLVTNRTGQTLEILDSRGTPVIRIGPDRTWVSASAPAYYSEHPMREPMKDTMSDQLRDPQNAAASKAPRWVLASREPSWGWFDPRIQTDATQKPANWHIDMRLGADPVVVSGQFRARPVSNGYWMPAILTPHEIAPRVEVAIIPGVVPAVTIENGGHEPVTVIGSRGEPFLRIGPDGVFANAMSPTWMQSGRAPETTSPIALSNDRNIVKWTKISPGSRYTWLEWRARCANDRHDRTPMRWQIPLLIDNKSLPIRGETKWITLTPHPATTPQVATARPNN